jgi:hypothetical protein
VTIGYLTDEKPKSESKKKSSEKVNKSNAAEKEPDSKDKIDDSATARSLRQSSEETDNYTTRTKEKPRDPNALSVSARWGLPDESTGRLTTRRVTFSTDAFSDAELKKVASEFAFRDDSALKAGFDVGVDSSEKGKMRKKKNTRVARSSKRLGSSLDAQILRQALNSNVSNEGVESKNVAQTAEVSANRGLQLNLNGTNEETSGEHEDVVVPPLDLHDVSGTPRSILR